MCCSVLQCVAVCCSVLQCVAVCCSVLHCVAVCCSVLQCVIVCHSVLQCVAVCCSVLQCLSDLHCTAQENDVRYTHLAKQTSSNVSSRTNVIILTKFSLQRTGE